MRPIYAALAGLVISASAAAQDVAELPADLVAAAEALRTAGLEDRLAYDLTESLTTEVGARLAGTEAEARARDWGVRTLERLGFANVRVEPFEIAGWERGEESVRVLGPHAQSLLATALGGSVATPPEGIEAEVVRFADVHEIEALPEGALDGRIAFVDLRLYRTQDASGYDNTVAVRSAAPAAAAARGAAATLIRSVGTSEHRFAHTGGTRYAEGVRQIPVAALANADADQLVRLLERGPVRLALTLTPRFTGTMPSGNVIAEIPGSERPDEIVLVGAHIDSWDKGTGALDDAVGIGIVTAAAKLILDRGEPPKRTIRIVYFGAEEVGLLGAFDYAERHAEALGNHVIAGESDLGAGPVWLFRTRVGEGALPWTNAMQRVLRPLGIGLGGNDAFGGPDLIPLIERGVPVIDLFQDGTDYFDYHHTEDDTFDKVKLESVQQNVAAWAAFLWLAANLDVDFRR